MTRGRLLVLLLILLVLAWLYAWLAAPRQRQVKLDTAESSGTSRIEVSEEEPVDLPWGQDQVPAYYPPQRNPFARLYQPVEENTVAEQQTVVVEQQILEPKPPPKPQRAVRPKPLPQPLAPTAPAGPEPLPQLRALGYLQRDGELVVFLAGEGEEIYLLRNGESFSDGLLVSELDQHRVKILRPETGQTLNLTLGAAQTQRLPSNRFQSGRPAFVAPLPSASPGGGNNAAPTPSQRPGMGNNQTQRLPSIRFPSERPDFVSPLPSASPGDDNSSAPGPG